MRKLGVLGVAAVALAMLTVDAMAQRRGGAVSGGVRGAVVGGMVGGESGAETGANGRPANPAELQPGDILWVNAPTNLPVAGASTITGGDSID